MNVLITGGAKNGKSHYAQELARDMALEKSVPLYYVATMIPHEVSEHRSAVEAASAVSFVFI